MILKLYHISQNVNNGWDTYSDCVICAESEEEARNTTPNSRGWDDAYNTWCRSPYQVKVVYLGDAAPGIAKGFICTSFHAG